MILFNAAKLVLRNIIILSMKGLKRGAHITRYYMYRHLAEVLKTTPNKGKILAISHSKDFCSFLGFKNCEIIEANYPDYNILELPFKDNEFDYVVSDQVLEHVEGNPQLAFDETFRVLNQGGIAIHTTCFINPIHGCPSDFWRYTPEALKFLCSRFSKIIDVGGWGNPYVWLLVGLELRSTGIPEAQWHPMHKIATLNNKDWPIVTWVIAQK